MQGFIESASEKSVHYDVLVGQCRRGKLGGDNLQRYLRHHGEQFEIGLTIGRKAFFDIKEIGRQLGIACFGHQSGYGQSIAAIVAGTGKEDERRFAVVPFFHQCAGNGLRGTFHEVERADRLIFYGKGIELLDACCGEYLHHKSMVYYTG